MTQTTDQKLTKLQSEVARLDKVTRALLKEILELKRENQRMKYAIGRTSRNLGDAQSQIAKGLK